jgi:hypothetical protein
VRHLILRLFTVDINGYSFIDYVFFIIAYILWKLCRHIWSTGHLLAFQGFLLQVVLENVLQIQLCFVIIYNQGVRQILPREKCTNLTSCFFCSRQRRSAEKNVTSSLHHLLSHAEDHGYGGSHGSRSDQMVVICMVVVVAVA